MSKAKLALPAFRTRAIAHSEKINKLVNRDSVSKKALNACTSTQLTSTKVASAAVSQYPPHRRLTLL